MAEQKFEFLGNLVELRDVLQEPYYNLIDMIENAHYEYSDYTKNYLFQAFCGIGKSRAMYKTIFDTQYQSYAFVFPSLGLVEQFVNDYINDTEYGFGIMNEVDYDVSVICSTKEIKKKKLDIECTTVKPDISNILDSDNKKIICVTYQSLHTLNSVLKEKNMKIDLAIFDEAHNSIGDKIHQYIKTLEK